MNFDPIHVADRATASRPSSPSSPATLADRTIRRSDSPAPNGAGESRPEIAAPADTKQADAFLQVTRKSSIGPQDSARDGKAGTDLLDRIPKQMPLPLDAHGCAVPLREAFAPPLLLQTLSLVEAHLRKPVVRDDLAESQEMAFNRLRSQSDHAITAAQEFSVEVEAAGKSIVDTMYAHGAKRLTVGCAATARQLEGMPGTAADHTQRIEGLMRRLVELPSTEHTRMQLQALLGTAVSMHNALSLFCVVTSGAHFSNELASTVQALHAAIASRDDRKTTIVLRLLEAYRNDRWSAGVRQTFAKLKMLLASIDLIEHPAFSLLPARLRDSLDTGRLMNYAAAMETIHALAFGLPLGISGSLDVHRAYLARRSGEAPPGPRSDAEPDPEPDADARGLAPATQQVLRELALIDADAAERLETLVDALGADAAAYLGERTDRSSMTKEEMQDWRDYCHETAGHYRQLVVLWQLREPDEEKAAAVAEVIQRWEDAFGLAATLLGRYAGIFCKSRFASEQTAASWLDGHLKLLASTAARQAVPRRSRRPAYRLKASNAAPQRVIVTKTKPPLQPGEIRATYSSAIDRIRLADQDYRTANGYASFFKLMSTDQRRTRVATMRSLYDGARNMLERLSREPALQSDLASRLAPAMETCEARSMTLGAVLSSQQINVPLEYILAPRWRDGKVKIDGDDAASLETQDWVDEKGHARFEQFISVRLQDDPVTASHHDRPLEPFPVEPCFMHIHLDTDEDTMIDSVDGFHPSLAGRVRFKTLSFNKPNQVIRKEEVIKQGLGTDGSVEFACEVMAEVLQRRASAAS